MEKKNNDIKIREYSMICHINMTKVHKLKHSGIFVCEGLPLHNKKFIHEIETEVKAFMEYGKSSSIFYLDENNSKKFKKIESLVSYYNKKSNGKEN